MNKKGRKPLPKGMRCVTTSIRLRPDRLAKYKEFGGIKWLNWLIDKQIEIDSNIYNYMIEGIPVEMVTEE